MHGELREKCWNKILMLHSRESRDPGDDRELGQQIVLIVFSKFSATRY